MNTAPLQLCTSTNISTGIPKCKPTSRRCGLCENCLLADCGECKYCRDKPAFGGPGKLKQACIKRKCLKLTNSKPGGKYLLHNYVVNRDWLCRLTIKRHGQRRNGDQHSTYVCLYI